MEAPLNDTILAETVAATVVATVAASEGEASPATPAVRGQSIGRYLLLSQLGAGAMGVVFAAYDPELDRKVALKVLKHQSSDVVASRKRLQREAQALAKLDHSNVVAVHDVGVHNERLFIAMEYVEGITLGTWMAEAESAPTLSGRRPDAERALRARPWREVLAVFIQAGRGLQAAHEVGLVHRDFKPDNVMLSDDGRVRVMDFGLARGDTGEVVAAGETGAIVSHLTQAGSITGTPAYMSLEQFEGTIVDARSDQFSFCVAVHEALYGERPFGGDSVVELVAALQTGTPRDAPRGTAVPGWVRSVVLRGLARDPAARFASMRALLDALAADPVARRRRILARVGLALVLALSAWGLVTLSIRLGQRNARIAEQAGEIDEKNVALADQLAAQTRLLSAQRGLRATMLIPEAREAEALILAIQAVDAYAEDWADAPREALEGLEQVLAHDTVLVTDERVLAGHQGYLTEVEYSPDGTRLATSSFDGTARVWDAASGRLVATLAGDSGALFDVGFAPDGSRLATVGSDGSVRIWDVATSAALARCDGHTGPVVQVAFSPDSARLATAGSDGSARIWGATSGELRHTLRGPGGDAVQTVAFAPDGSRVASAGAGATAWIWDVTTGARLATLAGHTAAIHELAFSPDGSRLATASADRSARTWSVATGELVAVLEGHGGFVMAVAYAPDGSQLTTVGHDTVARVHEPETGALLRELRGGHSAGIAALAYRPDGARVVTTSYEGSIAVWDPATGERVERLVGHPSDVWGVEFSPDGRHIATAGVDGTARIWGLDYTKVAARAGPERDVQLFTFTPDHARIVTSDELDRARVWDVASGELLMTLGDGGVRGVAASPDGRHVATIDEHALRIWDLHTDEAAAALPVPEGAASVYYAPDGARIYSRGADAIWIFDAATAERLATIKVKDVFDLAFSPDGAQLAVASEESVVRIWDARSGQLVIELAHPDSALREVEWSPDGAQIATANRVEVRLWDARTYALLATCEGHRGLPRGLVFSPDGARLVGSSNNHGARIWDTADCRVLASYQPDDQNPKTGAVVVSPDGRKVALLSDQVVRICSAETFEVLMDLDGHGAMVSSAVFSPDGARLTTLSGGTLKTWEPGSGALVSRSRIGVVKPGGAIAWPTHPRELTRIACERLRMHGRVIEQVHDTCAPLLGRLSP